MRESHVPAFAVVTVLVVCGFFYFPGHTFLHSDTQIYIPILERLRDPGLYPHDMVAQRPHVSFTIYDEMALLLRKVTGQEFRLVLHAQQIVFRICGMFGVFLVGRALGFPWILSLLLASIYGLGGTIGGPSVLIHEYEPVPRGFAGPLVMLAIGLFANDQWRWGGVALAVAVLYHPPTTYPVMIVLVAYALWKREFRWIAPVAGGVLFALLLSKLRAGETEPQNFFGTIDAALEKLQRLRGSYNWISMWGAQWIRHHQFASLLGLLAIVRLKPAQPLRAFWIGLPIVGLAAMPASFLLLDTMKWQFLPQFQPLRAVLFITLVAMLAAAGAAIKAGLEGRWWESFAWFVFAFAVPAQSDVMQLLFTDWRDAEMRARMTSVLILAGLAASGTRWLGSHRLPATAALALAMLAPFYLFTAGDGRVRNYRNQDQPEIRELAAWARANTPKETVFLFPDADQALYPGFFRAYSLRNVYADWKGGGQVNLLREFAIEWWDRWQKATAKDRDLAYYASLGVNYVVFQKARAPKDVPAVWQGATYAAFATRSQNGSSTNTH